MSDISEETAKEYIRTVKAERRRKATERMGSVLGAFGKLVPKGIRHPDSLVRNVHLYKPGMKGRTILK